MNRSILVTGSTGFIGRSVTPLLRERYRVAAPSRAELDLLDDARVAAYLEKNRFDAVIHLANPTGQSAIDAESELFERTLRVFASLERCSDLYGRMIYIGSGAEYAKHRAICGVTEEAFGVEIPRDRYGFARYILSKTAAKSGNIIGLRLFACHGPGDPPHKLIPHVIRCIRERRAIALRQDVWFDYLYVEDICPVLEYFIENPVRHQVYNLCSGERLLVSSIAEEVRRQMNAGLPIVFEKSGLGLEYTGSAARLREEMPNWKPRSMSEGIRRILEHENRQT